MACKPTRSSCLLCLKVEPQLGCQPDQVVVPNATREQHCVAVAATDILRLSYENLGEAADVALLM